MPDPKPEVRRAIAAQTAAMEAVILHHRLKALGAEEAAHVLADLVARHRAQVATCAAERARLALAG